LCEFQAARTVDERIIPHVSSCNEDMCQAVKGRGPRSSSVASESHMAIIVVVMDLFLAVFLGPAVEEVERVKGLELELSDQNVQVSADRPQARRRLSKISTVLQYCQ